MWTERQTDMTKLIVALCSFLHTHTNSIRPRMVLESLLTRNWLFINRQHPAWVPSVQPLIIGVLLAFFLGTFTKLQKVTIIFFMSVYPQGTTTAHIFMKCNIWVLFGNMLRKFQFHYNLTRIMGTLHEDHVTFMIICHPVHRRMRNVSDKSCKGNQNTHFTFNNFFFQQFSAYEVMWKNTAELDGPQMIIWHICILC